jgi:ABC-type transport system substrate-binding protein
MRTGGLAPFALTAALLLVACSGSASPAPSTAPSSSQVANVPSFEPIADGQPTMVVPQPGTLNPHDVAAAGLGALVEGRHIWARLTWWSGVEPCNVLDSITLQRDGTTLRLTIREGTTDLDAICIEIAMLKATIVDLGEFEPGTYTVSAFGDVPPVTVEVR